MLNEKKKILAVEDSPEYQAIISKTLQEDYEVTLAEDAKSAYAQIDKEGYDLILLDIVLPDSDGYEICSFIRGREEIKNIPIIFVTSKETVPDKIMGFSLGADDYITKPFNALELKARIAAKLRMSESHGQSSVLHRGPIEIHTSTQRVYLKNEQSEKETIDLTTTEFRILHFMAQYVDHVLGRDQILNAVWGQTMNVTERTVDTHVSKLRKKLKEHGDIIKSIHGSGYRMTLPKQNEKAA